MLILIFRNQLRFHIDIRPGAAYRWNFASGESCDTIDVSPELSRDWNSDTSFAARQMSERTRIDAVELELLVDVSLLLLGICRAIDSLGSHDVGISSAMQANKRRLN